MSNNPYRQQQSPPATSSAGATTSGKLDSASPKVSEPADAPPTYGQATGSGSRPASSQIGSPSSLQVPAVGRASSEYTSDGDGDEGIPREDLLAMEDEQRELPEGWIRQYDEGSRHFFYVDTTSNPPRSIWVHPYSDRQYVMSLPESSEVRQHYANLLAEAQDVKAGYPSDTKSGANSAGGAAKSDSYSNQGTTSSSSKASTSTSPTIPEKRTFGRKMKDKLTGTSHEERVKERNDRKERDLKEYQQFLMRRQQQAEERQRMYQEQGFGNQQQGYYAPPSQAYPSNYGARYPGSYGYGGGYGYGGRSGYGGGYYGNGSGYYDGGMYGARRSGMGAGVGLAGGLLGGLLLGDLLF
ncbi:hypothetical protein T439DRAFT_322655 [Meredithblackwellia eburnea MCA 4105]